MNNAISINTVRGTHVGAQVKRGSMDHRYCDRCGRDIRRARDRLRQDGLALCKDCPSDVHYIALIVSKQQRSA